MLNFLAAAVALVIPVAALAGGEQTAVLDVQNMTCSVCPITVKKALSKIEGVVEAKVIWEPKEAVVTYDDTKTTPAALTKATENAGYPSTIKE